MSHKLVQTRWLPNTGNSEGKRERLVKLALQVEPFRFLVELS